MVDALKLKIKTLPFGTHAIECHLDESFFNIEEQNEVRRADVDVILKVTRKSETTFRLEIACDGTVTIPCDRCLDDLDLPVEVDYCLNVEQMGTELDDSNDELLIVPSDWRELDAAPIVRDTVLLAIPMTHCHENKDDCNADMLDVLERHLAEAVPDDSDDAQSETTCTDPRWEALKKLKEQ
jgi:Predicted metal-binding, possibly nucleic acid-binding protein